ncbi:MAG TPA: DUF4430 domain-containing protein [Candidatus Paceibacterota bacterium]
MASTNKKVYFAIFGVIALCLVSIGLLVGNVVQKKSPSQSQIPIVQSGTSSTEPQILNNDFSSTSTASDGPSSYSSVLQNTRIENERKIFITLKAGGGEYSVSILPGGSVYDVMTALTLSSFKPFIFEAENYPSLGYFVKSINGVKNSGGYYWTLYVNGQYSTLGATQYILKEGDRIEWKYVNNPNN